ncbi:MAG: YggT family protein [Holosporaceae bacterium]|jgi:YggT family protein|nr:YggT family protein [Holosporaceae bacterium]
MDILLVPLLVLFKAIISLAMVVVVSDVIISWLMAANMLNTKNQLVYALVSSFSKISEVMLRPIRKIIPTSIGLDISPVVLILLLTFIENVITRILMKLS